MKISEAYSLTKFTEHLISDINTRLPLLRDYRDRLEEEFKADVKTSIENAIDIKKDYERISEEIEVLENFIKFYVEL